LEQAPLALLQVPARWHASLALQVTAVPGTQMPAWQVSLWVQALASLHGVLSATPACTQVKVRVLQLAVWQPSMARQSESCAHVTHKPVTRLHTGVRPAQRPGLLKLHWPHAPEGWQSGVTPPQSESPEHPMQTSEGPQTGVLPRQSAPVRQPTQDEVVVSQRGEGAAQVESSVQTTQAPLAEQAGVAPPHSELAAQPRQTCELASQTGLLPEQSAPVRQPTHEEVEVLQRGVGEAQVESSMQATHWPLLQTGVLPAQAACTAPTGMAGHAPW
jgi:hypothetical protein